MPNNHFYIAYSGNKRNEFQHFYNNVDLTNITTIIEPFGGTHAISYFLWEKHPNLKFIINDVNPYFYEMYKIYKDEEKIDIFNKETTELIKSFKDNKILYNDIVKENNLYSWFISHKVYSIRPGLFPNRPYTDIIDLRKHPIYNFYKNADIEFYNEDGINIYEKYKNDESNLIFLDPPYLDSCNDFYKHKKDKHLNIYEYLYNNNINNENANIYLMLEDIWMIRLIFKNNFFFQSYNKKYEQSKKKTSHVLIKKSIL